MNKKILLILATCAALLAAGCGEQSKIDKVKATVIPNCQGKTMETLTAGLLQNPKWGYEEITDGRKFVTVNGTLIGDSLPGWVKDQKVMDVQFRFGLNAKEETFDPASLNGFPSLTSPEGIFQAYKAMTCE